MQSHLNVPITCYLLNRTLSDHTTGIECCVLNLCPKFDTRSHTHLINLTPPPHLGPRLSLHFVRIEESRHGNALEACSYIFDVIKTSSDVASWCTCSDIKRHDQIKLSQNNITQIKDRFKTWMKHNQLMQNHVTVYWPLPNHE
jgi:hypothetical protein